MTNKFLIGIGAAFFSVFVLAVASVVSINSMTEQRSRPATTKPAAPSLLASPGTEAQPMEPPPAPVASPDIKTAGSPQISPPGAVATVQDSDLQKLADAVKLGRTNTGDVGKDVWAREVPVAQKLLQGLCDCDQRNWLKHFVETGNQAVSGSEQYYQSVQILATLRRNDRQLATDRASH
jgi:hypothetical protein